MNENHVVSTILGGVIGDAIGYSKGKKRLLMSDDTQMTLFTIEGILWSINSARKIQSVPNIVSKCFYSYQRWLYSQGYDLADDNYQWILEDERLEYKSPLLKEKKLCIKRAPETTCIEALRNATSQDYGTVQHQINHSKKSGAIMRVAPIGLYYYEEPKLAFDIAKDVAAITHSHPTG